MKDVIERHITMSVLTDTVASAMGEDNVANTSVADSSIPLADASISLTDASTVLGGRENATIGKVVTCDEPVIRDRERRETGTQHDLEMLETCKVEKYRVEIEWTIEGKPEPGSLGEMQSETDLGTMARDQRMVPECGSEGVGRRGADVPLFRGIG
mmetsp:Transcript_17385/g.31196  ORF Transcript_17385/g.31196 Transcript_17385/m.31196 type:complete len:156 (+) Transcript_17385:1020-1487(+)